MPAQQNRHDDISSTSPNSIESVVIQPGPFAAIDLTEAFQPSMRSSIKYKMSVDLNLPRNEHNKNLGNFMVRLAVTPNIHEFIKTHGPSSLVPQSPFSKQSASSHSPWVKRAGLLSRFPLTHFPDSYILDLPKLYTDGPKDPHNNDPEPQGIKGQEEKDTRGFFSRAFQKKGLDPKIEMITVLATRPAIVSFKPLLLEYLEMLFWSPLYVTGFLQSGFSEKITIPMVENWTTKSSPLYLKPSLWPIPSSFLYPKTENPVQTTASTVAPTHNPNPRASGDFQDFFEAAKSLLRFRKAPVNLSVVSQGSQEDIELQGEEKIAEKIDAENIIGLRDGTSKPIADKVADKSKKKNPKRYLAIKDDGTANLTQENNDENSKTSEKDKKTNTQKRTSEPSDGHVWAVIEFDRIADLNSAHLTLHTQWEGLRFWMHKYRLLLFLIGPFILWVIECFAAVVAAYFFLSFFGSSNNKDESRRLLSAGPSSSRSNQLTTSEGGRNSQRKSLGSSSMQGGSSSNGNQKVQRHSVVPDDVLYKSDNKLSKSGADKGKASSSKKSKLSKSLESDKISQSTTTTTRPSKVPTPPEDSKSVNIFSGTAPVAIPSFPAPLNELPIAQSSPNRSIDESTFDELRSQNLSENHTIVSSLPESVSHGSMIDILSSQSVAEPSITRFSAQGINSSRGNDEDESSDASSADVGNHRVVINDEDTSDSNAILPHGGTEDISVSINESQGGGGQTTAVATDNDILNPEEIFEASKMDYDGGNDSEDGEEEDNDGNDDHDETDGEDDTDPHNQVEKDELMQEEIIHELQRQSAETPHEPKIPYPSIGTAASSGSRLGRKVSFNDLHNEDAEIQINVEGGNNDDDDNDGSSSSRGSDGIIKVQIDRNTGSSSSGGGGDGSSLPENTRASGGRRSSRSSSLREVPE